jgi:hypothetical protein
LIERAISLYSGRRANCALAVAQAWSEGTGNNCSDLSHFHDCGHGRAPEGTCGALYAARTIAGPQHSAFVDERFSAASGGATQCRDIRSQRALACLDCVRVAAQALSDCLLRAQSH